MADLAPLDEDHENPIPEAKDCIDRSRDVERYSALVRLARPNLDLRDLLYLAQREAISHPESAEAAAILAATVARYESFQAKGEIPARAIASFALCRLQYFAQIGDAGECDRILRGREFGRGDRVDLRRALERALVAGHCRIADAISDRLARCVTD